MPVKNHTPSAAPAHGACPACGHCKCCEKPERQFVPYFYPDWTYRPWYTISGASSGNITATTGAASSFTLTSEAR